LSTKCRRRRHLSDVTILVKNYKLTVRLNNKLAELFLKSYTQAKKKNKSINDFTTSDHARNLLALGLASNYGIIEKKDPGETSNIYPDKYGPITKENADERLDKIWRTAKALSEDKDFHNLK